jgi:hypothetical protein
MAQTSLNVYGFSVLRKSRIAAGQHSHEMLAVATTSVQQAKADILALLGSDLAGIDGPTLIATGVLYSGSAGFPGTGP